MNPDEMLAYTGVVAWRTRRIARGGRSRSGVAPVSGEWQAHGGKAGHNVTTPTWGLVLQIVLWGCVLWFVRARAAWKVDLPALARVRRWGSRFVASYLLVLVVLLLVELLPFSSPALVVLALLLLLNGLALVLLLGVLDCLVWAWVLLARDWMQRRGPLARSRELAEDALLLGHTHALAGGTEDELLAEIAGICQEEGWARESAEAQRQRDFLLHFGRLHWERGQDGVCGLANMNAFQRLHRQQANILPLVGEGMDQQRQALWVRRTLGERLHGGAPDRVVAVADAEGQVVKGALITPGQNLDNGAANLEPVTEESIV